MTSIEMIKASNMSSTVPVAVRTTKVFKTLNEAKDWLNNTFGINPVYFELVYNGKVYTYRK